MRLKRHAYWTLGEAEGFIRCKLVVDIQLLLHTTERFSCIYNKEVSSLLKFRPYAFVHIYKMPEEHRQHFMYASFS